MICPQCKTQNPEVLSFCQRCGTHLLLGEPQQATAAPNPSYHYEPGPSGAPQPAYGGYQSPYAPTPYPARQVGLVPADKLIRWLAWFIDSILIFLVIPIALIPFIGGVLVSALMITFWLMRDIKGASPGKQLLGLQVVSKDGQPASREALIKRNLPFGLPHILHVIPYLGTLLLVIVLLPINWLEAIMVIVTGERVGDKLAGTMVVKK